MEFSNAIWMCCSELATIDMGLAMKREAENVSVFTDEQASKTLWLSTEGTI